MEWTCGKCGADISDCGMNPVIGSNGKNITRTDTTSLPRERLRELESALEDARDFMHEVVNWSEAYPPDVFGPVTVEQVAKAAEDAGFRIDNVTACIMREFTKAWGRKAKVQAERADRILAELEGERHG